MDEYLDLDIELDDAKAWLEAVHERLGEWYEESKGQYAECRQGQEILSDCLDKVEQVRKLFAETITHARIDQDENAARADGISY